MFGTVLPSFNRTIIELKLIENQGCLAFLSSFNRTIIELKRDKWSNNGVLFRF